MVLVIKHVVEEGPGLLADFLKTKNCQIQVVELAKGEKLPSQTENLKAVVSLGGPMNVYQEKKYPFLKQEDKLIKKVVENQIPFLGICLGAQLLAKAQKAAVKKGPGKELGWSCVNLTKEGLNDHLFFGLKKELEVFQWHDDTFAIPKGGFLVAEGDFCKNQAFRLGKSAWGLQFHVEATPQMIKAWLGEDLESSNKTKRNEAEKIVAFAYKFSNQLAAQAKKIFTNFYRIILS
jgi:GMP synthase-like glutamine amidotransferase